MKPEAHSAYLKIRNAGYGVRLSSVSGGWDAETFLMPRTGFFAVDLDVTGSGESPEEAIVDLYEKFATGIETCVRLSDWSGQVNGHYEFHLRGASKMHVIGPQAVTESDNENALATAIQDLIKRGQVSVNGARRLLDKIELGLAA